MDRLTLVISSLSTGGAERVMATLANQWAEMGRSVTLITTAGIDLDFYFLSASIQRRGLDLYGDSRGALQQLTNNARRLARLRAALRASRPEAVISFGDVTNCLTLLATRGLGVPVIISERVDPGQYSPGRAWAGLRCGLYWTADAVVVQTEEARGWIQEQTRPRRVEVIPNPVVAPRSALAAGQTDPELAWLHALSGRKLVVGMGRLQPQKGFDLLLRAFARNEDAHPDWSLVILGEGGDRSRLESLAQELGIAALVHLPGVVPDPARVLSAADFFVLSSRFEGFPNALLEAMACGLPVIAVDCPSGPRAIVREGVDGLLVPRGDVAGMAAAMARLMSDPPERESLGARAVEVTARFSLGSIIARWETLLHQVQSVRGTKSQARATAR